MMKRLRKEKNNKAGFTLLESVIGIALVAIAILGLAQMFTLSVLNNMRSDRITTASFLVQQQIDVLRNLTAAELSLVASSAAVDLNNDGTNDLFRDELIDLNQDNLNDYRRITDVVTYGTAWQVQVLVFTAEAFGANEADLISNPQDHRVRARVSTIIHR
ncbi:MAG: prepilin-type N-terminal cleavage/methylation domain-containing protein [Candidatus Aminicenantales bacterium]